MPVARAEANKKNSKKVTIILVVLLVLTGLAALLIVFRLPETQVIEERAEEPAPSCPVDGASCEWAATAEATSYSFEIVDMTTGETVRSGVTQETKVAFTPEAGHRYRCSVKAINVCGEGPEAFAENTCVAVGTPTPTQAPTETPVPGTPTPTFPPGTPSPTPEVTETPTPSPTVTPTPNPSGTPTPELSATPTDEPEITPTPTEIILVKTTNTPAPSAPPTETPTPTPPVSGIITPTQILFGISALIIVIGLIL